MVALPTTPRQGTLGSGTWFLYPPASFRAGPAAASAHAYGKNSPAGHQPHSGTWASQAMQAARISSYLCHKAVPELPPFPTTTSLLVQSFRASHEALVTLSEITVPEALMMMMYLGLPGMTGHVDRYKPTIRLRSEILGTSLSVGAGPWNSKREDVAGWRG